MIAIVLGVTINGLAVVRSLGRRGITVYMLERPGELPGMRSRFGKPVMMPDVRESPDQWLVKIAEIASSSAEKPVLIPTGDDYVVFVSRNREALGRLVQFRIPPADVVEMLCDKGRQYEFLAQRGYAVPKTIALEGEMDIAQLAQASVGFPCLLKPRFSDVWRRRQTGVKAAVASNAQQLQSEYAWMVKTGDALILQEFIPGDDSALHGYLAYYGADRRPLAAITKQKLRQYPPICGTGSLHISTHNPELAQIASSMLDSLNYTGMVTMEFKWDFRDRLYKLMEINPRGAASGQLAIDCGADLPYVAYQDIRGVDQRPMSNYPAEIKHLHFGWDVQSFLQLRRMGKLTLLQWLRSLWGVRSLAVFSWQDPLPFIFYAVFSLKELLRRSFKSR